MKLRSRLQQLAEDIRGSYWFLPALLALFGLLAGLGLVALDARLGDQWLGRYEWLYGSRPDGARQMLSAIASSTITVAGVVFSITLAAVTYASGQYGPRLLTNFTRDRGNQASLGVFVGTFLFCLIVLRTVRSAEETSADTAGAVREAFVPHLAMFGALGLAVASIAVLIYFVHHVTVGIHINNVIARIGLELIADIRREGEGNGEAGCPGKQSARPPATGWVGIAAEQTGYIEAVDTGSLVAIACREDIVLKLARRPGDFVHKGRSIIDAESVVPVRPEIAQSCRDAISIGKQPTGFQDLRFGINELVEIAARALSPGVNDPFTAIACIDWLGAALSELGCRPDPTEYHTDQTGLIRLVLRPLAYHDYLNLAFGRLRSYAARDPNASRHAVSTLIEVAASLPGGQRREMIEAEQARLVKLAARSQEY